MRLTSRLHGSVTVFGHRLPTVAALLIGITIGLTALGAVGTRNGFPWLLANGVLVTGPVLTGQVWRLATWPFFFLPMDSVDWLNFLIGCFVLWWLGSDLVRIWGPVRFLLNYLGFAVAIGVGTCLLGLLWTGGLMASGPWAVIDALIIAFATLLPHRQVLLMFMLPVGGRNLVYATIAGTILFALLHGLAIAIPHFVAEGLMLVYLRDRSLYSLWLRLKLRAMEARSRRRPGHLRPVGRDDDLGKPPRWLH